MIDARVRDGSLRQAAVESGKTMLVFEGGEASRFDPLAINAGTAGVIRVLNHLGMTSLDVASAELCVYARRTWWGRASKSGIVHLDATLGQRVQAGEVLATIYDPFGQALGRLKSKYGGLVIGNTQAPLVNRGDAVSHVARLIEDDPSTNEEVPTESEVAEDD